MRQYTTTEQTVKLIALGFPRPKFEIEAQITDIHGRPQRPVTIIGDYSIGELIEMLPTHCNIWDVVDVETGQRKWNVGYIYAPSIRRTELVDALYDMIVKLKEKGVI